MIINSIIADINKFLDRWRLNNKEQKDLLIYLIQNFKNQRK